MNKFEDPIEFCFGRQLKENKPLTIEDLSKLEGRSIYSEYKEGDVILWFILQEKGIPSKIGDTEIPCINISIEKIVKRDIDIFMKEFSFIRMTGDNKHPVFEKKSKVSK